MPYSLRRDLGPPVVFYLLATTLWTNDLDCCLGVKYLASKAVTWLPEGHMPTARDYVSVAFDSLRSVLRRAIIGLLRALHSQTMLRVWI
jgi:hypothetical protein